MDASSGSLPAPALRVGGALRRILVVDDSPTVRAVVGDMLARLGHKAPDVAFADGAEAALADFAARRPGVVLLDLELGPDGGAGAGAELAKRILADDPKTRIILMTGFAETDDAVRGVVRQGAFGYLGKPLRFEALQRVLGQVKAEDEFQGRIR
jgi:twitching motility two-component system response regulator PilH